MKSYPGKLSIRREKEAEAYHEITPAGIQRRELDRLGQRPGELLDELRTLAEIRTPAAFWPWRR
jgi:hypothetical protein